MDCRDMQTTPVCLRAADGSRVSAIAHYEYGVSADAAVLLASTRITDALGDTLYDPAAFEEITVGVCPTDLQCWKDKFIEGGLDNTFTSFLHTNQRFVVTFSDDAVDEFAVASATGWTDQVQQMAAGLDAIMPWAQTVEPFCNLPGGCGGLPGPAVELSKMFARYVGFRVCPGDKVPVRVQYTSDQLATPKDLVVQYVETETIYIDRCVVCGVSDEWMVDGKTYEPVCAIPCSEAFPAVPLTACTVAYLDACDDVGSADPNDWVNITRVVQDCGSGPQVSYLQEDAEGVLVEYALLGTVRDCASGEPPPEPVPECDDFVITELFQIVGKTPGLRNREWTTDDDVFPFGTDGPAKEYAYAFDYDSAPDTDTVVTDFVASLNDTSNTANELDLQLRTGYLCVAEAFEMRWFTGSEGALLVRLGKCCGPLEEVLWFPKDVAGQATPSIVIPAGIHKLWILNQDSGGSNSNWQPETSTDGVNWTRNDRVWDDLASTSLPREVCKKVKVCKPSGALVGLLDGVPVDPADCYACSVACEPCCSSGGGAGSSAQTARITETP